MEYLQQSKWRCDVRELQGKHARDRRRLDNVQILLTIVKYSHTGMEQVMHQIA